MSQQSQLTTKRDYQRSRVYEWEWKTLPKYDKLSVPFAQMKQLVDYVWFEAGLEYPPEVKTQHGNSKNLAESERLALYFPTTKKTRGFTVLHEIAHAMNQDSEGTHRGAPHGPEWLGIYMNLLNQHLLIPIPALLVSASHSKLHFDLNAEPVDLS